jgi:bifunctional UDP-N-acetylglucosamine pyrophosphorylase/glucosamine-1-phosphate N-acetyltransferase
VLDEVGHPVNVIPRLEPLRSIWSAATRTPIEMALHDRVIAGWRERGTSMPDPRQISIDATVTLGQGVQILPGSVVQGSSVVGDGAIIGPNTQLVNALIGSKAHVPHSVVIDAEVGASEQLRPFSVLGSTPD